jgi:Zn finger protein HypA/HybF involved in hydrogenase expression
MSSCRDLRKYQDNPEIADMFGQLISGRKGYKTIIEKSPKVIRCSGCSKIIDDEIKFCPECGTKVVREGTKP